MPKLSMKQKIEIYNRRKAEDLREKERMERDEGYEPLHPDNR